MKELTMNQIGDIEFWGKQTIHGDEYAYKDYTYKSEIYKNGRLFARIDNRKPVTDDSRVEYVEQGWVPVEKDLPTTEPFPTWRKYLVCYKNGEVDTQYWADGWNCSQDHTGKICRQFETKDVVAWMPLPLPYETEEKEGE